MRWRGALSFSYERVVDVYSQLQFIICSHAASYLREGNIAFELITEDLITPTQEQSTQRSKDKGRKLVSSQNQCSL